MGFRCWELTERVWHSQRGFLLQIPHFQVLSLSAEAHLPVLAPRKPPQRVEEGPSGPGSCLWGYNPWGWHNLAVGRGMVEGGMEWNGMV